MKSLKGSPATGLSSNKEHRAGLGSAEGTAAGLIPIHHFPNPPIPN
jgi:hypothetical protein